MAQDQAMRISFPLPPESLPPGRTPDSASSAEAASFLALLEERGSDLAGLSAHGSAGTGAQQTRSFLQTDMFGHAIVHVEAAEQAALQDRVPAALDGDHELQQSRVSAVRMSGSPEPEEALPGRHVSNLRPGPGNDFRRSGHPEAHSIPTSGKAPVALRATDAAVEEPARRALRGVAARARAVENLQAVNAAALKGEQGLSVFIRIGGGTLGSLARSAIETIRAELLERRHGPTRLSVRTAVESVEEEV